MSSLPSPVDSHAAILSRLIEPELEKLPPKGAEYLLSRDFCQSDRDRMHKLAAKARVGYHQGLEPLVDLALNLCWMWSRASDRLWHALDPEVWRLTQNGTGVDETLNKYGRDALRALWYPRAP